MGGHILQTFIQPSEHTRELLAPHEAASPWSIQASRDRFEEAVVFQVLCNLIRQLSEPLLLLCQPLALLLKSGGLGFNGFERVGQ